MLLIGPLKTFLLPPLTLVAAEIIDVESAVRLPLIVEFPLEIDQSLPRRMNGEPPQIGHDPAPPQFFSHGPCCSGTAEEIGDKVAYVGRCFDDPFDEGFGFLGGVENRFNCRVI